MSTELTLADIKAQWNDVLDLLMERDRVIWLAFFDARLDSYEDCELALDFIDATKFSGEHDFKSARRPEQFELLQHAINQVMGISPKIREV